MKAAPFDYLVAESLAHVTDALAEIGDDALIIAGGQTLVPMMAMRLARPALLIDVNGIDDLQGIESAAGNVCIKACTRQAEALSSPIIHDHLPLLAKALPHIGHTQTRNRGTVGGSIALGDPAAEIPLVATALDASVTLRNRGGSREVLINGFYEGPLMTTREPDECITQVNFSPWAEEGRLGTGFQEVNQRHGDFAIVAAAAQVLISDDGICRKAAIALGGVHDFPLRASAAEEILTGIAIDEPAIAAAADTVNAAMDPGTDLHASAAYRRRVAKVLVARVIREALEDANGDAR